MSGPCISVGGRIIGDGASIYVIAEISANHNGSLDEAIRLVETAKAIGADAVKLQTYTPDTITIDCHNEHFRVGGGTIWEGKYLYDLYAEAYTPWEWHATLFEAASELGLHCFSTPFDPSAVDFLEGFEPPAYKIASFEIVDIPLVRKVASTARPLIMSTGMATLEEIRDALVAAWDEGATQIALLKCNSGYPAPPEEMNLRAIPALAKEFGVPIGLSDHTFGLEVPVAAVALGACILEKHLTSSRAIPGPDSQFSLEPEEFRETIVAVRRAQSALGTDQVGPTEREQPSKAFRRSLFVVKDIGAGEPFTLENVRSIRPAAGLPPKNLESVLGRTARVPISRGTPLDWDLID